MLSPDEMTRIMMNRLTTEGSSPPAYTLDLEEPDEV